VNFLKSLIKRFPTLFGAMLLIAIGLSGYVGLIAVGQAVTWFIQLFCDYPVVAPSADPTPKLNFFVALPIVGLFTLMFGYLASILLTVIFFIGKAILAECRAMGFWLVKHL
jgi:hypothetical protein